MERSRNETCLSSFNTEYTMESAAGALECGPALRDRFSPASLLAPHRSKYGAAVHGQQAGPAVREKRSRKAGPHSRTYPATPFPAERIVP